METMTADDINDLRRKILQGEEYSIEDLEHAVMILCGERVEAARAAETKTTRKRQPAKHVDLSDLLPSA